MADGDEFADDLPIEDGWDMFRDEDGEPIGVNEFKSLTLKEMPEDVVVHIIDDYFPETAIWRQGDILVSRIEEHLYTKYWEHKFSAYAFAEAMERAVLRLSQEGHPLGEPERDDSDVHIFVRWVLKLPRDTEAAVVTESVKSAFDLVWQRAEAILENSDSILVLGNDSGEGLDRLHTMAARLQELGYFTYIIKEQPDKSGESVIQKVMRHALSSKFVLIENTEASGHLYEIPHVTKAAECVTAVLQEEGRGSTWMFEDAYAKHKHWRKFAYAKGELIRATDEATAWAEEFIKEFSAYQVANLPWFKKK